MTTDHSTPLILLVEDDPDIAQALHDVLVHEGYRALTARTGGAAIARAQDGAVTAVLLDLGLPDLDGLTVLRTLKDVDPTVQVIVLTARLDRKAQCLAAGAYAFLSKPYRTPELRQVLQLATSQHALLVKVGQIMKTFQTSDRTGQQQLLDSFDEMVWFKDCQNRILRVNRHAAASLGLTVEQVEGQSTYHLYPDEAEQYYRDDLVVLQAGVPRQGIVELYDGATTGKRWVQTDKVPYREVDGTITGVLVFARDMPRESAHSEAHQGKYS